MKKRKTSELKAFDKLGNQIKIGDYILYACSLGRSPALNVGLVKRLEFGKIPYSDEKELKIRVIAIAIDSDYNNHLDTRLNDRESLLSFPDRTIVVSSIPEKYKRLFNEKAS